MDNLKRAQETLAEYRESIEMGAAIERLLSNSDFQRVILQGYIKQAPAQFAEQAASQSYLTAYKGVAPEFIQQHLAEKSRAPAHLFTWLNNQQALGVAHQSAKDAAEERVIEHGGSLN